MSGLLKDFSIPSEASTSQEGQQNRRLKVTLLSSEWRSSTDREFSTISRELAIQLAKQPDVEVSVFLPKCSEEDKRNAISHNIQLVEADKLPGFEPILCLSSVPRNHDMDCVIGHGVHLGRQIPLIKRNQDCRWIQVVHSLPEEMGLYKNISEGEQLQQTEVDLCQMADEVVAIGPKVADAYKRFLRSVKKEKNVFDLTPSLFSEFLDVEQATEERRTFCVLVIGSGASWEDFNVKGFDIAAKAITELNDMSYKLTFVYSRKEKLEEMVEKLLQLGISRNQLIVHSSNDSSKVLANLFCEADLAIMPSRTEGFGLPGLEALSAGLPVLVSGNTGLGEALKNVHFGSHHVIDSVNPEDWAREIKAVRQKSRTLRLSETKLLRDFYQEMYGWEKPCKILVEKMQNVTFGSSEIRSTTCIPGRDKRPSSHADTDFPSKTIRRELTHLVQHGALESSTSCHLEDLSRDYGHFPFPKATEKPTNQRGHTQGQENLAFQEFHHPKDYGLSVFTKVLKAEYNRRSLLKPLLWQNSLKLPLEDVYTRLSIVSRRKTDFRLQDRTVDLFDVFKTLEKGEDSMVLAEGSPGSGKTTLCTKISYDWANQKIPNEFAFPVVKLLLLLKCRDIHGDVRDAIVDQLLPEGMDGKLKERLIDYIEDIHNQESILIILDGLDELPVTAESHVDKLLYRRILPFCYVLATTRQEKGIVVRQRVDFDVLLQIEGFTEADSFEYIRKHFSHFGPDHVSKGERLIQSIQGNTFLHGLPSNPLNLLLLCVVFEDYEGNLPSSRTELYHIIVCCLLRRYCAKNNLKAAADDKALVEQFKDSLQALGQLAWRCLLEDRFSFREEELAEFERTMKTLAARKLGLVFKEASLRKINPQHEYHFFHKTFQEYLAALYLAHKLLREKVNVFRDLKLSFREITTKYNQVFIFVSGILGEDVLTLFDQIGESLQMTHWDWPYCTEPGATFFIECFSENRNAEQMAMTLCSYVPFPQSMINDRSYFLGAFPSVVNACKSFTQIQLPVHFTVFDSIAPILVEFRDMSHPGGLLQVPVEEFLASYSRLETIVLRLFDKRTNVTPALCSALEANSSLHSFTLERGVPFSSEEVVAIGNFLAASKTLQTVTLKLPCESGENWTTVLEGLSGDTPLTSVVLEIYGSVWETEKKTLKSFLSKRSLKSFSLAIYGDMRDSLATSIGEGLAAHPCLQSFTLIVNGSLSCSALSSLKKGVLRNSTLKSLELKVFEGLPDNWVNICEVLYATKMSSSMSLLIEPNTVSKISTAQVACLCPVLKERVGGYKLHSCTVNMWGELSCSGASDLCKLLIASRVSCVNLNIHGRVTDSVATCLVENFDKVNSSPLSDLSINIRGGLTRDGNSTLQALKCNQTFSFTLNVQDVNAVDEVCDEVKLFGVDSSSLKAAFTKFESICSRVSKLSLNLDNSSEVDWECIVGDVLAKFVSLAALSLSFSLYGGWNKSGFCGLWSGVAQNTSITALSITVNDYDSETDGEWVVCLYNILKRNTSITTLSVILNSYRRSSWNWQERLCCGLEENTSVTTLSMTWNVYFYFDLFEYPSNPQRSWFKLNSSLTTLSIKVNNYKDIGGLTVVGLLWDLEEKASETTLNISANSCGESSTFFLYDPSTFLSESTSRFTLNLALNSHSNSYEDCEGWIDNFIQASGINESPIKVCLEVNVFSERNEKS